jgi:hypothetical protein
MKFLQKYGLDIHAISCFVLTTNVLWLLVDEAPIYFYIKYFVSCVGMYALAKLVGKLIKWCKWK